jgi:hypothetical protein
MRDSILMVFSNLWTRLKFHGANNLTPFEYEANFFIEKSYTAVAYGYFYFPSCMFNCCMNIIFIVIIDLKKTIIIIFQHIL